MAFLDIDRVEEDMDLPCEDMDVDQLISYFRDQQRDHNNVNTSAPASPERNAVKWLIKTYGQIDGARILRWLFYNYRGVVDGEVARLQIFNPKMKWWTDKLHLEMQQTVNREMNAGKATTWADAGFATGADL